MATIDNSNWGYGKPVEGDSQATAPGSAKVQPVILDGSLSEGSTGNGNIGYDTSRIDTTDLSTKLQSIVFTEPDGSTTKAYEVENPEDLGTTNEVVVWIYDSGWATDDTVAFNFYSGGGDGTDYSYSTDPNVTGDTGANPWEQAIPGLVESYSYNQSSGNLIGRTTNNYEQSFNGTQGVQGQFADAAKGDGIDDVADTDGLNGFGNFTYGNKQVASFWIKPESGALNPSNDFDVGILSFNANNPGWGLSIGSDNTPVLFSSNASNNLNKSGTALQLDTWYHIVAVFDQINNRLRIYVDGNIDIEETSPGITEFSTSNNRFVSFNNGDNLRFLDAALDQITVFDVANSSDVDGNWIQAEFDASPKGGQIFFNANQGSITTQPTDQVGSVKQTNSSGVVQTTADGVIKTEP